MGHWDRFKMLHPTRESKTLTLLYLLPHCVPKNHITMETPCQISHKIPTGPPFTNLGPTSCGPEDPFSVKEDLDVAVILVGSNDLLNAGPYIDQWSQETKNHDVWLNLWRFEDFKEIWITPRYQAKKCGSSWFITKWHGLAVKIVKIVLSQWVFFWLLSGCPQRHRSEKVPPISCGYLWLKTSKHQKSGATWT